MATIRCAAVISKGMTALPLVLFSLAFAILVSSTAVADEPTLSATAKWLRGNLPQVVQYEYEGKRILRGTEIESFEDCRLAFYDRFLSEDNKRTFWFSFDLSRMDPGHVRLEVLAPGAWFLVVPAANGEAVVQMCIDPPCGQKTFVDDASFPVHDQDWGKRLVNAMRHAVTLCGGKPDPF